MIKITSIFIRIYKNEITVLLLLQCNNLIDEYVLPMKMKTKFYWQNTNQTTITAEVMQIQGVELELSALTD